MGFRTPLATVRGHGSAKDGTHHWWMQRLTAIAMIPLCFWLIYSLLNLILSEQTTVQEWLQSPFRALLLTVFIGAMTFHAKLGIQVIIEDYVHASCSKYSLLLINTFGFILLFLMAVMAIFKLHML
ncbi:MAG: succinate dehydrogenase, hydrophobic membrane anchor protein [Alphaproteobacteria bacterium]|nr:succinate dehydrogenase, hydrophobic membrane anchor protein [Alphaproteobacteria bacterium]